MKKIAVLASGGNTGGGSGFEKLFEPIFVGDFPAQMLCVLSNHQRGGVYERARRLGVRFIHFEEPWTAERCYDLIGEHVDLICMSGWLKLIKGLDPQRTINIHPGPLPDFGGRGMHGHHVHESVMNAYHAGKVTHSAVSMHFVTNEYDKGPVFFQLPVEIKPDDTPGTLGDRVNAAEHEYQWKLTKYVLEGRIAWDGINPDSLVTA